MFFCNSVAILVCVCVCVCVCVERGDRQAGLIDFPSPKRPETKRLGQAERKQKSLSLLPSWKAGREK
jgi:hypothetical protein